MRTMTRPEAMLARLANEPAGRLPLGKFERRGRLCREHPGTAAALVRRGYAQFILGPDGDRWVEITIKGRTNTGGAW
jgi:hypothetical protein